MERNLNSILGASDLKKKSLPTCALSVNSLAAGWGWPGPKEISLLVLWHSPSCLHAQQVCEVRVSRHLFVLDMYGIKRNLGGEFSFCFLKISIYLGRLYQACCWVVWKWKLPCSVWRKSWRIWLGKVTSLFLSLGVENWHPCHLPPWWRHFFLHHILLLCIPSVHSCKGWRNHPVNTQD